MSKSRRRHLGISICIAKILKKTLIFRERPLLVFQENTCSEIFWELPSKTSSVEFVLSALRIFLGVFVKAVYSAEKLAVKAVYSGALYRICKRLILSKTNSIRNLERKTEGCYL